MSSQSCRSQTFAAELGPLVGSAFVSRGSFLPLERQGFKGDCAGELLARRSCLLLDCELLWYTFSAGNALLWLLAG